MSKATVKKILMSMPKEKIIGMVLEMYDARKEAKEYLEFYANPDEDGKLGEYKKIITEEFGIYCQKTICWNNSSPV